MAKLVVGEADAQAVEGDRGLMPVPTVFDLASMHPVIPGGEEVDLEAVLAGLLSESGSITPKTMKEEAGVDPAQLAAALHAIEEQQKHKIEAMMDALSQERGENLAVYQRLEAESAAYEAARVGVDIGLAKTNAEIGAKNGELREARKALDILVENFRPLRAMLEAWSSKGGVGERGDEDAGAGASSAATVGLSSSAGHEADALVEVHDAGYDAQIMLKTYQQDAFEPESEDKYKEVRRFALVSENLRGMEGQALKADILHPLEAILMHEAVAELQKSGDVPCGVVCDIFVRTEDRYYISSDG